VCGNLGVDCACLWSAVLVGVFGDLADKQFLETPWYGSRQPVETLLRNTLPVNEWHDTCSVMVTNVVAIAPLGIVLRITLSGDGSGQSVHWFWVDKYAEGCGRKDISSHACKHALPGSAWTVKVAGPPLMVCEQTTAGQRTTEWSNGFGDPSSTSAFIWTHLKPVQKHALGLKNGSRITTQNGHIPRTEYWPQMKPMTEKWNQWVQQHKSNPDPP
jgi:hypothetical protein